MVIDTHAHVIVPEITRDAAPTETWRPRVVWEQDRQIIEFAGKRIASAVREFVDIEGILDAQMAAGVDHVLLCPWVSILRYDAEPNEGLRISEIQNRGIARLAQTYPNRVSGLGTVPLQAPDLAARTLQELMREPGLHGVEVAASVRGTYLGDDRFRPFWAAAEESGALVFIHPTTRGFDLPVFDEYYLWNTVGNPTETAITAAHMIMAGVMERHPRLKVLLAHGGGTSLALRGRLDHAHSVQPQARRRLAESPSAALQRFYFDTLTHDANLLHALIEFVGADRVLLGSDYPFDMGDVQPADSVRALDLSAEDEARILGRTAAHLLELEN